MSPTRCRHPRTTGEVPRSVTSGSVPTVRSSTWNSDGFADLYEVDPHTPVSPRDPVSEDLDVAVLGGGFVGSIGRRAPEEGRRRELPDHRSGRRLRRRLVLEPLSGHPVRQRRLLLHPAARRDRATCRRRSSPTAPRSTSTASRSGSSSTSTTARSSPPWSAPCAGTTRSSAGGSAPTAATISARASWSWRGPLNRPKLPGIPGIKTSRGSMRSTPRAGTTTTPAATPTAASTSSPTSAWRSSARARRRPGGPVPRPRRQATLRVPAHTFVRRRARQHADRSRVGEDAEAGLAEGAQANFHLARSSACVRRTGPGLRLLDRAQPQHDRADRGQRRARPRCRSSSSWSCGRRKTTR